MTVERVKLRHDDLARLARVFVMYADLRDDRDRRINEWLKVELARGQLFRRDDEDPLDYQDAIDRTALAGEQP